VAHPFDFSVATTDVGGQPFRPFLAEKNSGTEGTFSAENESPAMNEAYVPSLPGFPPVCKGNLSDNTELDRARGDRR
jgi:hypothetical protein